MYLSSEAPAGPDSWRISALPNSEPSEVFGGSLRREFFRCGLRRGTDPAYSSEEPELGAVGAAQRLVVEHQAPNPSITS